MPRPLGFSGALVLSALFSCARLARGPFIEGDPAPSRAGVLALQWRRQVGDESDVDWRPVFRGAPAYDPVTDRVFVGSAGNGFYALRASDGVLAWRFETLGRVESTPTVDGDSVYFGSRDGALYAVATRTGALRWRVGTASEVTHAPVVTADAVYFVNGHDTVVAVNRADGVVRWRYRRSAPGGITLSGHAGLTRAGTRLYTGFSDGVVTCLDASDGSVVWEQDTSSDIENLDERNEAHEAIDVDTTPVLIGDTVYVASFTAGLYALDAAGGGRRWRLERATRISGLGTDGRHLFAASAATGLMRIDPFDGSILWARDLNTRTILDPAPVAAGVLAVPTLDRALWLVRTSDGEPLEGVLPGRGFTRPPAVAPQRLFAISNGSVVYAFSVGDRALAAVR